jgi:hypothetical protein
MHKNPFIWLSKRKDVDRILKDEFFCPRQSLNGMKLGDTLESPNALLPSLQVVAPSALN